jgi:hypothetical protein
MRQFIGAFWAVLCGSSASLAQPMEDEPEPHERCDRPVMTMPPATARMEPLARWMTSAGGAVHVQVNVDGEGLNILGDAGNEPTIAVDPTAPNRMAICWRQFDTVASDFRQAGYSFTVDGGRSWSPIGVIQPGVFRSDPVLAADGNGDFHFLALGLEDGFTVWHHLSTDGGATWGDASFAFGGDKQWFSVSADGRTLYQNWSSAFSRSLDGGASWETPIEMFAAGGLTSAEPIWGNSAIGPDGALYIVGRFATTVQRIVLIRSDEPASSPMRFDFGVEVPLGGSVGFRGNPNPGGMMGMPQVAVNHAPGALHGEVYALLSASPGGTRIQSQVHFARSTDRGETWSEFVRLNDDPAPDNRWHWFATMSVAPNGRIDVAWLDMRDDPTPVDFTYLSALYRSFSEDGGRTWSANERLSVSFDSRLGFPSQAKMGDYFHMASDDLGADLAWCATFEGEQNIYYTRIGPRDCDRNGVDDEADLLNGTLTDCDGDGVPDACEIAAGVPVPCFGCVADFAEPFGLLDLADLVSFVVAFTGEEPRADLAEPFGLLDLGDVLAFVEAFAAGCG